MKSLVLEEHEFKNHEESVLKTILAFVVHQYSRAEKKLTGFEANINLKKGSLFNGNLGGLNQSWKK